MYDNPRARFLLPDVLQQSCILVALEHLEGPGNHQLVKRYVKYRGKKLEEWAEGSEDFVDAAKEVWKERREFDAR